MNVSSGAAAGRSRSAEGDLFLRSLVGEPTGNERGALTAVSPHAWKRALQERIWSAEGPKGLATRSVLALLLWHADAQGRVWLGIQAIASKVGAGSLRTVRHALESLAREGWLQRTAHTWATLTAEQKAVGRPVPRRRDVGQAPNLYVVGFGSGVSERSAEPIGSRPGLVRAARPRSIEETHGSPPVQMDQGGHLQKCQGEPLAEAHHDPDPKGSRSRIVGDERVERVVPSTPQPFKKELGNETWASTWQVIVEEHASKTMGCYGLPPLPPSMKRHDQQALATCLDGASLDVAAKLRTRSGKDVPVSEVKRELAKRVMQLYFKRDNEHLRRVKHALRDLPREFHARMTEAIQMVLREHQDVQPPRQPPAEMALVEKEARVERPQWPVAAHLTTAREARRLLDVLCTGPSREGGYPRQTAGLTLRAGERMQDKPGGGGKRISAAG